MKRRLNWLERFFSFQEHRTNIRTEVSAGIVTFLTAAYIIFVNPEILGTTGMDRGALITVTCLTSGLATVLMGVWAKAPLMLAPGMGLNAFFAFGVCKGYGVPWQSALAVVFVSGLLFFALALLGIRSKVVDAIPKCLRLSISVGIGLFIAFVGFQNLGLIAPSEATLVKLGNFTPEAALGMFGFLAMAVLEVKRVRGSLLVSILLVSLLGMVMGLSDIPTGFVGFPESLEPLLFKLDFGAVLELSLWPIIFTFMYVDLFDSIGTFVAVSRRSGMVEPDGQIRNMGKLLRIDCLSTMGGALLGTSTVTTYVESAAGVVQGGRTGLTAVTTGALFLLASFFAPLISAVPGYATAPALIFVGIYMMRDIQEIQFHDWEEAVPAFLVILLMPLTYSISTGIMFGFISYALIKLVVGKWREIGVATGVISLLSAVNLIFVWLNP